MSPEQEKLQQIFTQALAKASRDERERYLVEACGHDEDLRRQMDLLLEAHSHAASFLRQSTIKLDDAPICEGPGSVIGHYKLREKVGEGGCGLVYVAEQEEPVRRRVALKVIKLGMDTRSVVARFEAERQALALMDHPNIAKVLDAGATETGRPYFVMELVRGIKITDYCDQNKVSTRERLDLFIKVCQAVQHAHQKGIIHRDLKPSNILVTLHDGVPVPKVIDFGIAKATEGRLSDLTVYTELHQFIGTPAYMSPEQAEMSGLDIDTRSDIYSLGVLLYELLTGCTPFDAKELLASGLEAMRRTIREQDPVRPSTRLHTLSGQELTTTAQRRGIQAPKLIHLVQGDLDWIVMKCLEKDRTRRYDTANGLASDLKRFLANEPVVARPPTQLYRFQKMVRRNRAAALAVGAVALSLLLGAVGASWQAVRATRAEREQSRLRQRAEASEANEIKLRRQAERDERLAKAEAAKSQQVSEFLKDMLKEVDTSVKLGRDTTILHEILDRAGERVSGSLRAQPEVEADVLEIMGDTYYHLRLLPQARTMHREALRLRQALFGTNHLAVATSLEKLSKALREGYRNQHEMVESAAEGERLLREAMGIRQRLSTNETAETVESMAALGWLRSQRSDEAGAESLYKAALEEGKRVYKEDDPALAFLLRGLGLVQQRRGELASAEANLHEALRILQKSLGDAHPSVVPNTIGILAGILHYGGHMAEAEKLYREQVAMLKRLCGDGASSTLEAQCTLSIFYACCGREQDAEPLWRNLLVAEGEFERYMARNSVEALLLKPSLVPLVSDSGQKPGFWSYSFTSPSTNWNTPSFDDRTWPRGLGVFGSAFYQPRTPWDLQFTNIWLRREFDLAEIPTSDLVFRAKYDDEIELFLNGVEAASGSPWTGGAYWVLPCSPAARATLKPGRNVIAIHVRNLTDNACVDVGLYLAPEWRRDRLQFAELLQKELLTRPGNLELIEAHAELLVHCGQWKEAAAGYATLIELQPTNQWHQYKLAPLLVQSGNIAEYEKLRKQMLDRYSNTQDVKLAERTAKACLLLPLSGAHLQVAAQLADTAIAEDKNDELYPYFEFAKGLSEYRRHHYADALLYARKVLEKSGDDLNRDAQAWMLAAMACQKLGQTGQAQAALAKGEQIAEKQSPKEDSGYLGDAPHDWIIAHVLLREAQTLFSAQPAVANQESR